MQETIKSSDKITASCCAIKFYTVILDATGAIRNSFVCNKNLQINNFSCVNTDPKRIERRVGCANDNNYLLTQLSSTYTEVYIICIYLDLLIMSSKNIKQAAFRLSGDLALRCASGHQQHDIADSFYCITTLHKMQT